MSKRKNSFNSPQPKKKQKVFHNNQVNEPENSKTNELINNNNVSEVLKSLMKKLEDDGKRFSSLFDSFTEVYQMSQRMRLKFKIPKLVFVGNVGDGKSSFIDSILALPLNFVPEGKSSRGTRIPVRIHVRRNQTLNTPKFEILNENNNSFESYNLVDFRNVIQRRTEMGVYCDRVNSNNSNLSISMKPLVVRIGLKDGASMEIVDTPGFLDGRSVNGEVENRLLVEFLENEVKDKDTVIVCSRLGSKESNLMRFVKRIDKEGERTIYFRAKLDKVNIKSTNDFESLIDENEGDESELVKRNPPVFSFSIPRLEWGGENDIDLKNYNKKYQHGLCLSQTYDFSILENTKLFSKKNYARRVGILNVQAFVQSLIAEKTLQFLKQIVYDFDMELAKANQKELEIKEELRKRKEYFQKNLGAMKINLVKQFCESLLSIMRGSSDFDVEKNGVTLKEERENFRSVMAQVFQKYYHNDCSKIVMENIKIPYEDFKLYGGSQIRRAMKEFEIIVCSQEFPKLDNNEIIATMGLNLGVLKNEEEMISNCSKELAQKKCNEIFLGLLEGIVYRILNIISDSVSISSRKFCQRLSKRGRNFEEFLRKLEDISLKYAKVLLKDFKKIVFEELSNLDGFLEFQSTFIISPHVLKEEYNQNSNIMKKKEDIQKRVFKMMNEVENEKNDSAFDDDDEELLNDEEDEGDKKEEKRKRKGGESSVRNRENRVFELIYAQAVRLFRRTRGFFSKYVESKFQLFVLTPLVNNISSEIGIRIERLEKPQLLSLLGDESGGLREKENECVRYRKVLERGLEYGKVVKNY